VITIHAHGAGLQVLTRVLYRYHDDPEMTCCEFFANILCIGRTYYLC